jgi:hypothetical protein
MEKAHAILELVALHCYDAATIVALSATNRQLKSMLTMVVKQNHGQLLLAAVQDCAEVQQLQQPMAEQQQMENKRMQAMQWLLRTAGASALDTAAMQLLVCAKQVPIQCLRTIVAAGGVPTWQQLAAAARNGHSVYQWLEVCMAQDIVQLPGMTALAEAVMLSTSTVTGQWMQPALDSTAMQRLCEEQTSQANWLDVLLVFLQAPIKSSFVHGLFRLLGLGDNLYHGNYEEYSEHDAQIASPQQQQQWVQWRSRQLAVLQGNHFTSMQQQQLLQLAVRQGHTWFVRLAQALLWAPLQAEAATAALKQHISEHPRAADIMVRFTAGSQLSTANLVELLHALSKLKNSWPTTDELMKLPAASQLSTEQMLEEAAAAMHAAEGCGVLGALCYSRAGRQLNEQQVSLLISAAVSSLATCGSSSSSLSTLVGAYRMTALCSDVVAGWLHSAVQCNSSQAVEQLLRLQAAKQLSIVQAVDLLAAAVQLNHPEAAAALANMQQASAIATDAMLALLQIAVTVDSAASAEVLCSMAAAAHLDAATVARLFKRAVALQQCATAAELLVWLDKQLQGQQQLWQQEQLQQLCAAPRLTRHQQSKQQQEGVGNQPSQQSMQQQQFQQELRKMRIGADVLKLLRLSVQQRGSSALRLACRTAMLQQAVEEPVAAALLQLAIEQGGSHLEAGDIQLFEGLCLLPAARVLDVQQVASMLLQALQLDNTAAVEVMSGMLPAAHSLAGAGDAAQQLLQLAADKGLMEAKGRAYKWFAATAVQLRRLPAASRMRTSM